MSQSSTLDQFEGVDIDLSLLEIEAKISSHSPLFGLYSSVFKNKGSDFAEVRPYSYGDDVRRIDWRVTARSNAPHIRVDHEERELPLLFIVDNSASFLWSSRKKNKRQTCAELIGILGSMALQKGDALGLVLFSRGIDLYLPPQKKRQHLWEILSHCLEASTSPSASQLRGALEFIHQVKVRPSILVIISDFQGSDWQDEIKILGQRHDIIPVLILDPRESNLQGGGILSLESPDGHDQSTVNCSHPDLIKNFKKQQALELEDLRNFFDQRWIDLLVHNSDENIMDNMLQYFHHRNLSQRHL